jgi:hypothetical protein
MIYTKAEEKALACQNKAVELGNAEDYVNALQPTLEALKIGSAFLHEFHYINFQSYQCAEVVMMEACRFELSVQHTRKSLQCLDQFQDGSFSMQIARKHRTLAMTLQDWAKYEISNGNNGSAIIEESYQAFLEAHSQFSFLFGSDHWYTKLLHKVLRMFDGEAADELVDL